MLPKRKNLLDEIKLKNENNGGLLPRISIEGQPNIFDDGDGPSPIEIQNNYLIGLSTPISHLSSSVQINDTLGMIDNIGFSENISRIDFDKYDIITSNEVVELDERHKIYIKDQYLSPTHFQTQNNNFSGFLKLEENNGLNYKPIRASNFNEENKLMKSRSIEIKSFKYPDQDCIVETPSVATMEKLRETNSADIRSTKDYSKTRSSALDNKESREQENNRHYLLSPIARTRTQSIKHTPTNDSGLTLVTSKSGEMINTNSSVINTKRVNRTIDPNGKKKINQYIIVKEIGK